jgi:hypothetical protein
MQPEVAVWVQCCEPACNKWRRMPPGYRADDPRFAGDWYCDMNPDREMAAYGCDAPEEVDEAEEAEKTRQQEAELMQARQRAAEFQRVAEMQRAAEMQRVAEMQRAAQFVQQHGAMAGGVPPPFFQPPGPR